MVVSVVFDILNRSAQQWRNQRPFRFIEHWDVHLAAPAILGDRHLMG
jgi:hypothetical protein